MPDTALEARHTKQWQEIGFQGKNPATDFRGMGVLGLYCLQYPPLFGVGGKTSRGEGEGRERRWGERRGCGRLRERGGRRMW